MTTVVVFIRMYTDLKNMRFCILVFGVLVMFQGCGGDGNILDTNVRNLSGNWNVFHKKYNNTVVGTTFVEIVQLDADVSFFEDDSTLSTGIIVVDTIRCDDMYGLGIGRIYIDDINHMHSETPALEYSNGLDFVRSTSNGDESDIE